MIPFLSKLWNHFLRWLRSSPFVAIKHGILKSSSESTLGKVLCVDDDPEFCLYIERLATLLQLELDKAYSVAEAKQKIEENSDYKAFLIDGYLPDGSGFELVSWIREEKELGIPIGFLSHVYQDAASFRLLKESLHVNYVVEKPILPDEVHLLLVKLCGLETESALIEEPIPDKVLAELRESYRKSIYDKIERIEKLILAVQKDTKGENLLALKKEVHKIAGSSGSHGYLAVSKLCRNLELELDQQIILEKEGKVDAEWALNLDHFFTKIKSNFQFHQ